MKALIVNADDFGYTCDVNAGIVEAHRNGILTATTVMATAPAFEDAVRQARENPTLDVGCHIVLVGGPGQPRTIKEFVVAVAAGRVAIYPEIVKQVRRVVYAELAPTHLDTHKHTHLLPPVLDALARVSEEFGIPWVRRPFDFPIEADGIGWQKRAFSRAFGLVRPYFRKVLKARGCRMTDYFAGFQLTGQFGAAELAKLIERLPEGTTEFMCHPGFCTDELRATRTRLRESREQELRALVSPEVREAMERCGVELTSYRKLNGRGASPEQAG